MDDDRFSKITEAQRACLRLVFRRMSSKEIGVELGITHHAVDQRIKAAVQTLSASNRFEAAHMLASHEGLIASGPSSYPPVTYGRTVYGSPEVAPTRSEPPLEPTNEVERQHEPVRGMVMAEQQAVFQATPWLRDWDMPLPFPTAGRRLNDLSVGLRLAWIVTIAIGMALAFGMVLAGLEALSHLT